MGSKQQYSLETKGQVVGMAMSGKKPKEISAELEIPLKTIYSFISRFHTRGTTARLQGPTKPKTLSERDIRALKRTVAKDGQASLTEITNQLPKQVSTTTVRKALHSQDLKNSTGKKLAMTEEERKARRRVSAK